MSHGPPPSGAATATPLPPDTPGPHSSRLGLVAEIFPLEMRGFAIGISVLILWITNFFVGLFFPSLVAGIGISYTFFLFAVIGALSFLFIWTMVPETRGRTLEQLEEDFREKFGEGGSRGPETAGAK